MPAQKNPPPFSYRYKNTVISKPVTFAISLQNRTYQVTLPTRVCSTLSVFMVCFDNEGFDLWILCNMQLPVWLSACPAWSLCRVQLKCLAVVTAAPQKKWSNPVSCSARRGVGKVLNIRSVSFRSRQVFLSCSYTSKLCPLQQARTENQLQWKLWTFSTPVWELGLMREMVLVLTRLLTLPLQVVGIRTPQWSELPAVLPRHKEIPFPME